MTDTQQIREPLRLWWARPRKLVVLERPGGGGRSHRPARRDSEIAWLARSGVRRVASTMPTRHNLDAYSAAGLESLHVPVDWPGCTTERLREPIAVLLSALRPAGALALHANRHTDLVAALGAALLFERWGTHPADGLAAAWRAGLEVTPDCCGLLDVQFEAVQHLAEARTAVSA